MSTAATQPRTIALRPVRFKGFTLRHLAFFLAAVLPVLNAAITSRFTFFHPFPFALDFLSMALIASLGGFTPAMLALFVTILSHGYLLRTAPHPTALAPNDIPRIAFLLSSALIISALGNRSRRYYQELESTVNALQESNAALVETLNSNRCASWTLDLDSGQSARWHRGSYLVFGRPFEEIEGMESLAPLLHPEDRPALPLMREQIDVYKRQVYMLMIFIRRHRGLRGRRAVYWSGFVFLGVLAVWAANSLSAVHRFKTP